MNIHIPEALIIPKTEQGNNFLTKFKNKYFVKINNVRTIPTIGILAKVQKYMA